MKIRYRERARSDIDDIFLYLEPLSPTGARNVLKAIYSAIAIIAEHPYSTEQTSDPDIRVKVLGRYRYKIFFTVIGANGPGFRCAPSGLQAPGYGSPAKPCPPGHIPVKLPNSQSIP
jgi:toxin ParE1/3/4